MYLYMCVSTYLQDKLIKNEQKIWAYFAFIGVYKYAFLSLTIRELQSKSSVRCEDCPSNGMTDI